MRVRVEEVDPRSLELLGKNARFMRHETFGRLTSNIERDGALTSVPFCVRSRREGCTWLVISGNHRVKGAIKAGLATIHIMVTYDEVTPDQAKAIQLAHNSLVGEDDPVVLKEIYESIDECSLKEYSGLDDKVLELLSKVGVEPLASAQLEWTSVVFLFLPDEVDRLKRSLEQCGKAAKERFGARFQDYDRFMEALALAGESYGVSNTATALTLLVEVFENHVEDLAGGFLAENGGPSRKGSVPAAAAIGANQVPVETAALLRRIVDDAGKTAARFGALEDAIRSHLERIATSSATGGSAPS